MKKATVTMYVPVKFEVSVKNPRMQAYLNGVRMSNEVEKSLRDEFLESVRKAAKRKNTRRTICDNAYLSSIESSEGYFYEYPIPISTDLVDALKDDYVKDWIVIKDYEV